MIPIFRVRVVIVLLYLVGESRAPKGKKSPLRGSTYQMGAGSQVASWLWATIEVLLYLFLAETFSE